MVVQCAIEFDNNPFGIYFAGQVLSGSVTLTADKVKQVNAILLEINGSAHTSWTETESTTTSTNDNHTSTSSSKTVTYSDDEDYIDSCTYLQGSPQNSGSINIVPGIHVYNFACHIPTNCPSSFENSYGHIRYTVRVVLVRSWKFNNSFTQPFTVLKIMNLNHTSPLLKLPSHYEAHKVYCCGPCQTGPLQMQISLPQSGFVPGQHIPVSVLVQNESKVHVEIVKIELVMLAHFTAESETKDDRIVLTKYKTEVGVLRLSNKRFDCELPVPATPPTCFNLCRIIQIAYQIEVEAKVKGWYANQVLCAPVTIGNVPLSLGYPTVINQQPKATMVSEEQTVKSVEMYAAEVNNNSAPDVTDGHRKSDPQTPWDDSVEPPSFESAVHMMKANMKKNVENDYGPSEFTPRYPVFNIPSPKTPAAEDIDDVFVSPSSTGTWL